MGGVRAASAFPARHRYTLARPSSLEGNDVRKTMTLTLGLFAILATACTSGGASPSAAAPTAAPTASTAAATTAPSVAPSASPDACAAATLLTPGKLTIGTDNPAYP